MTRRIAILLVALAALALPASALAAATNYRGKTSQGKKASARVVDGRITLVKLPSWSVPCKSGDYRFYNGTNWLDRADGPIEQPGDGTFTDSGPRKANIGNGMRAKLKETLSGRFDDQRVTGKTTITVRIYRGDKRIDTCKGTIRFDIPRV